MQERKASPATDLFSPVEVGPLRLPNRVAMAPLTRSRAPLPAMCQPNCMLFIMPSAPAPV